MSSFYLAVTLSNAFHSHAISSSYARSRSTGNFSRSPGSKVMDIAPNSESLVLRTRHPNYKSIIFIFEYAANFCLHSKKLSLIMDKLSQKVSNLIPKDVYLLFGRINLYGADAYDLVEKVPMVRVSVNGKEEYDYLKLERLEEDYIWKQIIELVGKKAEKKEEL
jgi:hypothetical protein